MDLASSRYSACQFSGKMDKFDFFGPHLNKNGLQGWSFKNLSQDSESAPPRYQVCQFSSKANNFDFFGPNSPKNGFWDRNFEILSSDLESGPPIYHVCQFFDKTDNFEFLGVNLGKLSNYVQYFGSYNVEGVPESWVETEISWVEMNRAGWSWVHGLVIPILTHPVKVIKFSFL